jgi:hypothetical protein
MGTLATGTRYIKQLLGVLTEQAPVIDSAGAADANKIVALNGSGQIDLTMMPTGVGPDTKVITTSEALSAGDWVNIWNSTGVKVRKADATATGKKAHGFVLAAASSGGSATVYFEGTNNQVSGMTVGGEVFLHTTAGAGSNTAPSTAGNVIQRIGIALSATEVSFEPDEPITLS